MSLLHAHPHESHLNFDPDSKPSVVRHPHETSQFWSLHWNQVNSHPPLKPRLFWTPTQRSQLWYQHYHHVIFGPCCFACYAYQYMLLWFSCITYWYNIITSTNSYCTRRFHATVKPRKKCVRIYTFFLLTWYNHDYVWYWWPDFVTFHSSCT